MSDLIARLRQYDKHNHRGQYAKLVHEAADALESLEAQLSALRDQQPVAPPREPTAAMVRAAQCIYVGTNWNQDALDHGRAEIWRAMFDAYAHPSCVSPDKPPEQEK